MDPLMLSALLTSRLCHDLVGPVGALNNGLELLVDEPDEGMRRQAIDLLVHSAGEAARRLKYYRLAYGSAGGESVSISLEEARAATLDLLAEGKINLDWPEPYVGAEPSFEKLSIKLLLNMILLGVESLPRGGTLSVICRQDDEFVRLDVTATGTGARLTEDARMLLAAEREPTDLQPRTVQPYLTAKLAEAQGTRVNVSQPATDRVEVGVVLPMKGAG